MLFYFKKGTRGNMLKTKVEWLLEFRNAANGVVDQLQKKKQSREDNATGMNKSIIDQRERLVEFIKKTANELKWKNEELLNEILLLTYASYIVMLEYRNKVWPYEYMAFSRRIGELWEPFCKLPFEYSVNQLQPITPPSFTDVQGSIKHSAAEYIDSLNLSATIKDELKKQYAIPWSLVDSGGIKLSLDLHFAQNGKHYNCDFKSGFSSNEKGNTNRLLLVASIYNYLGSIEKTLLFVRQKEDQNNSYLLTIKNSPYWDVYCGNASYEAMKQFTGFDLRKWLDDNADWHNDITVEFKQYLIENNLLKYLTW